MPQRAAVDDHSGRRRRAGLRANDGVAPRPVPPSLTYSITAAWIRCMALKEEWEAQGNWLLKVLQELGFEIGEATWLAC